MNDLINQIAVKENCFTHNNVTYEKLYNHTHEYRFFTENDYDYVEDDVLIIKLDLYSTLILKYIVKITFKNEDIEYYMSEHIDISKLLSLSDIEDIKFIEISLNS